MSGLRLYLKVFYKASSSTLGFPFFAPLLFYCIVVSECLFKTFPVVVHWHVIYSQESSKKKLCERESYGVIRSQNGVVQCGTEKLHCTVAVSTRIDGVTITL